MSTVQFLEPTYVWLLVVPSLLLVIWLRTLVRRRRAVGRWHAGHTVPIREHLPFAGDLWFWLCLIAAAAAVTLALARPQTLIRTTEPPAVDFVVLQDGSTSMRVADVTPDRWRRSTTWLRTFAEVLSWTDERVALALFAFRPAPQVRLTRDPNAFFFFLDHLGDEPPFRLEDDTSWDTNIEEGIFWGVKMVERDAELHGPRRAAKAFIVVSDGQAWSGEVDTALRLARSHDIRVSVVGVGTTAGGFIPEPPRDRYARRPPPIHSTLDRRSLQAIAQAGGGRYYELGIESDQTIALRILTNARRHAPTTGQTEVLAELYWPLLLAASALIGVGTLLLTARSHLVGQIAAVGVMTAVLLSLI